MHRWRKLATAGGQRDDHVHNSVFERSTENAIPEKPCVSNTVPICAFF
jgi:hypothetical protein